MKIEGKTAKVNAKEKEVFEFLSDMNNYEKLLPLNKISDWQANVDKCSFKVQGTYTISLEKDELIPNNEIKLRSGEEAPFPFNLNLKLQESDEITIVDLLSEAKVNSFLKIMIQKPLKNLFDYMSERLEKVFEED